MILARVRSSINDRLRQLHALRAQDGPYRFLLRSFRDITDVNMASEVMSLDLLRFNLRPVPLPIDRVTPICVLAPHQDDETIGAGGSLLLAAKRGATSHVVFLTDGAQHDRAHSPRDVSAIRRAEAVEVCATLKAQMHEVGISNLDVAPTLDQVELLARTIVDIEPKVLMVPWLLDIPPKHRVANHLLWLAHRVQALPACEVWAYQVHNALPTNGYVDITSVADEKRKLLGCFRSQNQRRDYAHVAMGLAAWNARYLPHTGTRRYAEVFFALPLFEYLRWVERFYLPDLRATYQGDLGLVKNLQRLQAHVLGSSSG